MSNDTDRYRCRACVDHLTRRVDEIPEWDLSDDEDYGAVLDHYAGEHRDHDIMQQIVDETKMRTVCEGCDSPFVGELHVSLDMLAVDNYCDDCVAENQVLSLVVDTLPGRLVVERAACEEGEA